MNYTEEKKGKMAFTLMFFFSSSFLFLFTESQKPDYDHKSGNLNFLYFFLNYFFIFFVFFLLLYFHLFFLSFFLLFLFALFFGWRWGFHFTEAINFSLLLTKGEINKMKKHFIEMDCLIATSFILFIAILVYEGQLYRIIFISDGFLLWFNIID